MAEMGYRDFLKGKGLQDNEITYNNGNIYAKGKYFGSATPRENGSTYGDVNDLNKAYNNYSMGDALDTFKANLSKPQQQFSYDPNTDPLYQNALGAAQRSAQTAGNNATVRLGSRGIGNSQQALTTENQIQQRSVADVNSNVLPQLMSQAYNRYHDQQVMDDSRNKDLLNLAGTYNNLGQQDFNNNRLTEADAARTRQEHIDLANMLSQQYGVNVDPKNDPMLAYDQVKGLTPLNKQAQDFNQKIAQAQIDNSTRSTNASISNMNADNARQAAATAATRGDNELATKFKIWEATGKAPTGIPGVEAGTPLASKPSSSSSGKPSATPISAKDSADNYNLILSDLQSDGVTKDQANQLLQANRDSLSDADYKVLSAYIQKEIE